MEVFPALDLHFHWLHIVSESVAAGALAAGYLPRLVVKMAPDYVALRLNSALDPIGKRRCQAEYSG